MKVIWTPRAIRELEALHRYISKDSIARASDMVARILRRSTQLAEFPQSGRVVSEFGRGEIREVIERPYRVIYRVRREAIDVLAVIHSSRKLL